MPTRRTNTHAVAVKPASYGHGTILASAADETRKSTQGRRMIRERVVPLGRDSIYNLTGLVRTFPLQPQDLEYWLLSAVAAPRRHHHPDYGLPWRCPDIPPDDAP